MKTIELGMGSALDGREEGKWVHPRRRLRLPRYLVAIVCVLVAFGIRYCLRPVLGEELPFLLFIASALIAAWHGGVATGIVALVLGLFLGDWFFVPVKVTSESIEIFRFARYILTASLGVVLIEVLHQSRRRAEAVAEELGREVQRRKQSEAGLLEAKELLAQNATHLERMVAERTADLTASVEYLRNLLYQIAHNLRAPLRAMEGYISILKEGDARTDTAAHHYLQRVSDAARRMDLLIGDLLDYGRLGHMEITVSSVSLKRAVDRALLQLTYLVQASKAEVTTLDPLPEVEANPELLEELIAHIVENAIEFVGDGTVPQVRIWAETGESTVRLCIRDNGIGIDPRYHARIFGLFETLHRRGQHEGNGVGLAIVQQGVKRMGGCVGVESEEGRGSRFWVELPIPPNPVDSE